VQSVFTIFAQGKNEPRKSESGMGVGLALVQAICRLHGGTVSASSDGLNCGSTFMTRLKEACWIRCPSDETDRTAETFQLIERQGTNYRSATPER
jgi:signal transduction histidine kinase